MLLSMLLNIYNMYDNKVHAGPAPAFIFNLYQHPLLNVSLNKSQSLSIKATLPMLPGVLQIELSSAILEVSVAHSLGK